MRCDRCGNVSDWVDDGADWTRLHGDVPVERPLFVCDVCGARRRAV
jgi:hypothetical protein